jgi:hypothetical protein
VTQTREDRDIVLKRLREMFRAKRSGEFSDPSLRPTERAFSDPSLRPEERAQEPPTAAETDKPRPPLSPE